MTTLENMLVKGYKNTLAGWNHGPFLRWLYVMDECKDVSLVKKTTAKPSRKAWLSGKQHRQKRSGRFLEDKSFRGVCGCRNILPWSLVALTKAACRASEAISLCCIGVSCRCDLKEKNTWRDECLEDGPLPSNGTWNCSCLELVKERSLETRLSVFVGVVRGRKDLSPAFRILKG